MANFKEISYSKTLAYQMNNDIIKQIQNKQKKKQKNEL